MTLHTSLRHTALGNYAQGVPQQHQRRPWDTALRRAQAPLAERDQPFVNPVEGNMPTGSTCTGSGTIGLPGD